MCAVSCIASHGYAHALYPLAHTPRACFVVQVEGWLVPQLQACPDHDDCTAAETAGRKGRGKRQHPSAPISHFRAANP